MKPRFEPDLAPGVNPDQESVLIDPDESDVSEQQFSASLQEEAAVRSRFVVDESALEVASTEAAPPSEGCDAIANSESHPESAPALLDLRLEPDPGSWRQEVAARVNNYRARRRSPGPRYPSLQLQFEEPEWPAPPRTEGTLAPKPAADSIVEPQREAASAAPEPNSVQLTPHSPAETARIIEFPRSVNLPPKPLEELADPVFDRPRILEAPEIAPSPPALGGILIEAVEEPNREKRPGFEMPLQPAPMSRRLLASGIDAVLVGSAFALFGYIFFRVTSAVPPVPQLLAASAGLLALFWVAYQYLLLVHAGTTAGLRLTRLELDRFNGSPAKQSLRRWRVLASVLSGASLGLGYAWCFLDEDQLCWHDRITRTYMAPRSPKEPVR